MDLVPQETPSLEDSNDITHRLPSLRFESALTSEEKEHLKLRARAHAITVSQCAQAAYFVNMCNQVRQAIAVRRSAFQAKASQRIQEGIPRYDVKIGILGCGRLGSHLAVSLLSYGMVEAGDLEISTRRPELLEYLQNKGVTCYFDNIRLAARSDVLFLCVLPSQLHLVVEELKAAPLKPTCLLYTFVLSVSSPKLKYLLNFTNIIKPEITWDNDCAEREWDYTLHINTALEKPSVVEKTSPLSLNKEGCVVRTSEKFSEMMLFAMVNMLTMLGVQKTEILYVINSEVLGETEEKPLNCPLVEENFVKIPKERIHFFPKFDLTRLVQGHTPVLRKLSSDIELRQAYQTVYCQLFQKYIQAQKYAPIQSGVA